LPIDYELQFPDILITDLPHFPGIHVIGVLLEGEKDCMGGISGKTAVFGPEGFLVGFKVVGFGMGSEYLAEVLKATRTGYLIYTGT
jgi:hypothetical protein